MKKDFFRLITVGLIVLLVLTPSVSAGSLETSTKNNDVNSALEEFQKQKRASFSSDEYIKYLLDQGLEVKVTDTYFSQKNENRKTQEHWTSFRTQIDNDFYYIEDFYEIYTPQWAAYCTFVITQSKQTNVQSTCKWMIGPTSYQSGETYNNVRTEHSDRWQCHEVNADLARENHRKALADGAWEMWPYCTIFNYFTGTCINYYHKLPKIELIPK